MQMPPTKQRDASGAEVLLPERPMRIVSLVPSVTETLFALGLGDRVVGVTEWCLHPADGIRALARVGGTKNPNLDAIARLEPDLVLANLEENREIDVRRLRDRGTCVWVDFPCTVAAVADHVSWLAMLDPDRSDAKLCEELCEAMARPRPTPTRRCFLAVWKDPWMTIGQATYAHDLLAHLGLENVFADTGDRYPRVDIAQVAARDPEIILLPDEPYAFTEADADALRGELPECTATRSGDIHVVDGTLAFWHGPRTATALRSGLIPGPR